jgi:ubiquinone/menaquinone biosynthesis C-methylase UbiE
MRGVEQIPWLYDLSLALSEWRGLGRWRAWLARGTTGRTLDLGAGTGRTLPLLPSGARGVGVDPNAAALARARRRAPGVPLVVARAEALPFRDGAFDTVLAGLVLCSVADPDAALAEARRVLRPGGALRLLEHVRAVGLVGRLQDLVQPAWTALSGGCHPNRETEQAVARAGFEVDAGTRRARGVMRRLAARAPSGSRGA